MQKKSTNRAKQFMPFDALRGLKEAYREKERILSDKKSLSEDELGELADKFNDVNKGDIITIVYYENGEYLECTGMVSVIDLTYKYLKIVHNQVYFDDIISIETDNI